MPRDGFQGAQAVGSSGGDGIAETHAPWGKRHDFEEIGGRDMRIHSRLMLVVGFEHFGPARLAPELRAELVKSAFELRLFLGGGGDKRALESSERIEGIAVIPVEEQLFE